MIKRCLSFMLAICIILSTVVLSTVTVSAETYNLKSGVLTINGTGDMAAYSSSSRPGWFRSRDTITSIVIGEGITSIGASAFYDCTKLTSVTLPSTLTTINTGAFVNCTMLATVSGGDNLCNIGNGAFSGCMNLK